MRRRRVCTRLQRRTALIILQVLVRILARESILGRMHRTIATATFRHAVIMLKRVLFFPLLQAARERHNMTPHFDNSLLRAVVSWD